MELCKLLLVVAPVVASCGDRVTTMISNSPTEDPTSYDANPIIPPLPVNHCAIVSLNHCPDSTVTDSADAFIESSESVGADADASAPGDERSDASWPDERNADSSQPD